MVISEENHAVSMSSHVILMVLFIYQDIMKTSWDTIATSNAFGKRD